MLADAPRQPGWAGLAGLLFGALVLCRPVRADRGADRGGRRLLLLDAGVVAATRVARWPCVVVCALVVIVPWMAYNLRTQGVFAIAGSGRFLLARTLKMDPGGFAFDAPPGVVEDGDPGRRAGSCRRRQPAIGRARWRSGSATSWGCRTPRRIR